MSGLTDRLRLIAKCDIFGFQGDKEVAMEAADRLDLRDTMSMWEGHEEAALEILRLRARIAELEQQ